MSAARKPRDGFSLRSTFASALQMARGAPLATVLGGLFAALWLTGGEHGLGQLAFVATYAIIGLGLVLIVGQAGQISLGHGALVALGAYAQALAVRAGIPPVLALPLAMAVAACGGWLAALPARRLGGLYFAMSTLALGLIVEELLVQGRGLTGGAAGLAVPSFSIFGLRVDTPLGEALTSLTLLALAWIACRRWCASPLGLSWRMVREDEHAAAAVGVDIARAKSSAFVIGGALAGLGGALYAHWIGFLSPEQFGMMLSFELLMLVFIGGARHLGGAVVGAAVIVALPQTIPLLRDAVPAWSASAGLELMLYGAILVAMVLLRPQGLIADRRQR